MVFPFGEFILFAVTAAGWSEKWSGRHWLYLMCFAWFAGKILEGQMPATGIWHWNIGRLAVVAVFYIWAWFQTKKRVLPLLFAIFILTFQNLFELNVPGTLPAEAWWFGAVLVTVVYLVAQSYWGMAAALSGAFLVNQVIILFLSAGVLNYVALPGEFSWHFGVSVCAGGALLRKLGIAGFDVIPVRSRKKRRQNDGSQPVKQS